MQSSKKARMLYFYASIFYEGKPGFTHVLSRFIVTNAELQPDNFGSNFDGFFSYRERILGLSEDINNLDVLTRIMGLGERCIDTFAKQRLPGEPWIDEDDIVAFCL